MYQRTPTTIIAQRGYPQWGTGLLMLARGECVRIRGRPLVAGNELVAFGEG